MDSSYVMKVWFSNSLGNGVSTSDLLNKFLITISSSESGSAANPVAQPRSGYSISAYNVGPGGAYDELAYQLPNLYNGVPRFPPHDHGHLQQLRRAHAHGHPPGQGGAGDGRSWITS